MKKVALAIAFTAILTACGSNTNTGSATVDTTKNVVDTVKADSTKIDTVVITGSRPLQPLK
jgi:ABC-type phosphate transport system substrate-binding protein